LKIILEVISIITELDVGRLRMIEITRYSFGIGDEALGGITIEFFSGCVRVIHVCFGIGHPSNVASQMTSREEYRHIQR
jgi:hypothetical protein